MPADVLGQMFGGGVPQRRLLAHRAEHDGVEVAAEAGGARARPVRIRLAHDAQELLRVARLDPVGLLVGDELVQHDAQRVHVARGRDGASPDLLRARVLGREDAQQRGRILPRGRALAGADELGDPEIEQRRHALGRHQDVAGLQVPVDDEVLVGVLHRRADLPEEPEAVADREAALPAVVEQRNACDVLHHEVRLALLGRAAVDQPSDAGVLQRGRDLALVSEPLQDLRARHPGAHELDGDLLLELVVGAPRQIHLAHAAVPDLLEDLVGADALTEPPAGPLRRLERRRPAGAGDVEELPVPLVRRQQRLHLAGKRRVSGGCRRDVGGTLDRGQRERGVEDVLGAPPVLGSHGGGGPISRRSHARAVRHSRLTVADDTPTTSAVSSTPRPPKNRSSTMRA